tara:strand:+ start:710 stop:1033 length:324 start_codon:yes stop_codon:yes gene_type:complete
MKNKKFTYLLIGLVALIWGFFFYMLFSDNTPTIEQQMNTFVPLELGEDSITFQKLNLAYKDPFLARRIVSSGYRNINRLPSLNPKIQLKVQKPIVKKPSNVFVWPKI